MALSRNLYSTQFLTLQLDELDATEILSGLPVQTASIERTVPTEDIMVLGKLGSVGRQQKEVETVKMDVKLFWGTGTSGNKLTHTELGKLTGNALMGRRSMLVLSPHGFTGYGILTSFGIDAGVGDFLTANLSFEGLGTPIIATTSTNADAQSSYPNASVVVYTTENVSLQDSSTETIKSAKFSIDLPTERLTRLGAPVTGMQDSSLTGFHMLVAKPPFKVSFAYDGELVTGSHAQSTITFGHLKVSGISTNITSQSYNQNVGDVGAAFSFSSEGTSCTFAAA